MTGGIVPLAVTLASEAVFEAFVGDSKVYSSVSLSFLDEFISASACQGFASVSEKNLFQPEICWIC